MKNINFQQEPDLGFDSLLQSIGLPEKRLLPSPVNPASRNNE